MSCVRPDRRRTGKLMMLPHQSLGSQQGNRAEFVALQYPTYSGEYSPRSLRLCHHSNLPLQLSGQFPNSAQKLSREGSQPRLFHAWLEAVADPDGFSNPSAHVLHSLCPGPSWETSREGPPKPPGLPRHPPRSPLPSHLRKPCQSPFVNGACARFRGLFGAKGLCWGREERLWTQGVQRRYSQGPE